MRIFEILLLGVNLLSLWLSLKERSKQRWLGLLGVNLAVLALHGLFEGFRYQLVFAYSFVMLFTIAILVRTNSKWRESNLPKALKIIAISVSLILLGATWMLAYALPVFTLPKPTGTYAVGIHYFHLVDEARTEPFLDQSTQQRELMVKIYYPAIEDDTKSFAPYFSPQLARAFAAFSQLPIFIFDHLTLVKTNAKVDLRLSDQQQDYPVVLFSHGAGTTMEVQTSQSEDLASHGYIVVAIDHTYVSLATIFPDKIVSHREAATDFNTAEPAEIITQIMADDAKFVIAQLDRMQAGEIESIFKGKLNLAQIGAIGHSVGGAVAYNLAINEPRLKAAIDLDGAVFIAPQEDAQDMAPFLLLANDKYHVQAIQNRENLMRNLAEVPVAEQEILLSMYGGKEGYLAAYTKAQQNSIGLTEVLQASGNLFTIVGSDHMKFSDIGLFIGASQLRELIGIGGQTAPAKCLEITRAVTVAFFDQHLKGESGVSVASLIEKYPELKKVDLR